jgi:uncharacterized YigZ family protein
LSQPSDPVVFKTLAAPGQAEFRDRGSRFLALAYPISGTEEFKSILAACKKEHPKAAHHCFAYRLGIDGLQFRVSDDGEPSGSAGRPILGQIDSRGLTDVLIIVVRYFGGTLLGVPGLIHAYKTAAVLALQVTPTVQKPVLDPYHLQFDYTQMNEVMRVVKQFDCVVFRQEHQLFSLLDIGIPRGRVQEVLFRFQELPGVEVGRA